MKVPMPECTNQAASPKGKPLCDVRYFENAEPPDVNQPMPGYVAELYSFPSQVIALGWRIGMKCKELGISIGSEDHLYLCFTPSLPAKTLQLSDYRRDPWHRFVVCGLSPEFNGLTTEEKVEQVFDLTFKALHLLAPDASATLTLLRQAIDAEGEALRIKIKHKATNTFSVDIEQNVLPAPRHAEIFVRVTNLKKALSAERKVAEVRFYDDAPSLVDRISITGSQLTLHPRKTFRASLVTGDYPVPIRLDLSELGVI